MIARGSFHGDWGAEMYITVTRDVPHAQMVRLSGTFLTKVCHAGETT
jgi:hypothetical protein